MAKEPENLSAVHKEVHKYFSGLITLARLFSLYPPENGTRFTVMGILKIAVIYSPFIFIGYGCFRNGFVILSYTLRNRVVVAEFTDDLSCYVAAELMAIFCLTLAIQSVKFDRYIRDLCTFKDEMEKPKKGLSFNANINKKLVRLYFINGVIMSLGCVVRSILNKNCEAYKRLNLNYICGLEFSLDYPYDFNFSPRREILLCLQIYCTVLLLNTLILIGFGIYTCMAYSLLRFSNLRKKFIKINKEFNYELRRANLRNWVDCHNRWLSLTKQYNELTVLPITVIFLFSSMLIGLLETNLILFRAKGALSGVHLLCWIVAQCMLHNSGQKIIDEGDKLRAAVCEIKWYEMDLKYRRDLLLILIRTQKINELNYSPFANLSHETLLMVLKFGYTLMTFGLKVNSRFISD